MEIRDASELSGDTAPGGQGSTVTRLHPLRRSDGLVAVDLWVIAPGGYTESHMHGEEHVVYVLAGRIEVSGGGASSSLAREGAVVYIGPQESHAIRNTGNEPARLLVSTPLLVRSDRAAPGKTLSMPEAANQPARGGSEAPARLAVREAPAPREVERSRPEVDEAPVADITSIMKRGSDLVGVQRPERRRPLTSPVEEPASEAEEIEDEAHDDTEEAQESQGNLMELFVAFEGAARDKPPGQGHGSYLVQAPGRKPVVKRVEFGDNFTANQAEYASLVACVEYIIERLDATGRGPDQVQLDIRSDSSAVVNQLLGNDKVRDVALRKRLDQALELLGKFADWRIEWHDKAESARLLGG